WSRIFSKCSVPLSARNSMASSVIIFSAIIKSRSTIRAKRSLYFNARSLHSSQFNNKAAGDSLAHRRDAAGRDHAVRYRPVSSLFETGKSKSNRLDQRPDRVVDD